MPQATIRPLRIEVPQAVLDDLHERLDRTRWPDAIADDWERGTSPGSLRHLVDHWRDAFDWRAVERRLADQDHQLVHIDGVDLHVLRAGTSGAFPLLLIHGWPDSFLRFEDLLPLLHDDFDLVVPSIPGYGFSARPTAPGTGPARIADLFAALMHELGFEHYGVHGGDLGSGIGEQLAMRHPYGVTALHLTDVPYWHLFEVDPATLSEPEQDYIEGRLRRKPLLRELRRRPRAKPAGRHPKISESGA